MNQLYSLHLWVAGRVQMVGFRFFTINRANRYRLTGWVKNIYDGRVEIEAEGNKQNLTMFLEDIRIGPPSAHVSNVVEKWAEVTESKYKGFDLIY
ncbi:MAG: acylphosphatase [Spirochaetota bacterium]|nr:MAG: acylphosphatase [Spirochaetota bacterium]